MKKLILWSILICLGASPAMAQSCTPAPSCSALGYTQTSSTCNSAGLPYIVCPFDSSKVFCGKIAEDGPHVGDLKYSLYSSNHDGWLLCNGTQYSQTTYSKLYNVIRTNFCHRYTSRTDTSYTSSSCKSGYFAVPDYRGFFLRAVSTYNASSNTVGATSSYYSDALNYKGGSYNSSVYYPQYEQLPNITGGFPMQPKGTSDAFGAFYQRSGVTLLGSSWSNNSATGFDASRSNSIYGGSHVIPANYGAYVFIYAGQ